MSEKFKNKVVVITGGNTGIGLASAKQFVAEGAYVFITGRKQDALDKAVAEIGKNVTAIKADSTKKEDIENLFRIVKEAKGHMDILVSNVGTGAFGFPIGSITDEHYDWVLNTNLRGTIYTVQGALPLLKDGSSIVLTGSISGIKIYETMSVYCASKAALRTLARVWAVELKTRKIRVNLVSPGPTETAMLTVLSQELQDAVVSPIPLGRAGQPDDVANAILFLASEDSNYMTGTELLVDGGATLV
ncbi:SDR family NAD(P)-dependent oxidoreductase [Flavobacterium sp. SM2513]|uniref:SDR family NAD(P)-dependent oxidoreductase n=1 Tax=Flavobacterium sp. SM2513 TaxID=3424766 RepID=UPI003D7FAEA0